MVSSVTKYIAVDGKEFDSIEAAEAHEQLLINKAEANYYKYMMTYQGRDLYKKYHGSTKAVWKVSGEDPNCDFGGHHHQPILGYFEGELEKVVRHAVNLPGFWQWGGGGSIEKQEPPKVVQCL